MCCLCNLFKLLTLEYCHYRDGVKGVVFLPLSGLRKNKTIFLVGVLISALTLLVA